MSKTSLEAVDKTTGEFKRRPAVFRNHVSGAEGATYPPESGRYILYVSYACPWASRCLAVIAIKGLTDAIKVVIVEPIWGRTRPDVETDQHRGWIILDCADPIFGAKFVREVYDQATPPDVQPTEVFSVPLFVDGKTKTIVNNESSEIIRFLNSEFNEIAKHPEIDLYPAAQRAEIDHMNDLIYNPINNGVYRCGFAQSQGAYDTAVTELFGRLDELEQTLSTQRFLIANTQAPTESDIRLFVTLIRFDEVYVVHFKTNKRAIHDYPNLHGWLRDMWQWDSGVLQPTVNMEHIKQHYYGSHKTLNPYGIIPVGPDALRRLDVPHGREHLSA
jgi:putative glutathione S-transferase